MRCQARHGRGPGGGAITERLDMDGEPFVSADCGRQCPSSAAIVVSEHARDQRAGLIATALTLARRPLLEPQPPSCPVASDRRDTARAMPEESTTPDPVERVRRQFEAGNRRDIDAVMSSFAVDAVLEGRALGDIFEGQAAIRAFVEGWFGMYEELEFKLEEVPHLGNGVVLAVVLQEARPAGIAGHVQQREGWVYVWVGGLITRLTASDLDEARAAAERLAKERE